MSRHKYINKRRKLLNELSMISFKKYMQHKQETLAEFVTRIMRDKSLSGYDIERLSKKGITQS